MLVPMPFFFGFITMLYSAAELRFAPFLWAHDISGPDTVGHIFGFPINVMPLLLGAVTFTQMSLTPQPTMDSSQAKMMKFMPLMFMIFCYTYPCALALYSTTNGLFMIGQQMLINRMKDDGDPTHAKVTGGKATKNVTPGKRR
jgi:YidC/Oxa1 family membrane protein insertase